MQAAIIFYEIKVQRGRKMPVHSFLRKICSSAVRLELALALAFAAVLALEFFAARAEQKTLAGEVLRLHVIANSDSEEDQRVKLLVRDEILAKYEEALCNVSDVCQAEELVLSEIENIEAVAKDVLKRESEPLEVSVVLENEMFPQRQYGDVILPAGEYRALRVIIGSGEGENWWCVMFPPLCCFAENESGDVFGEEWEIATEDNAEIRFKLKILEIFRRISFEKREPAGEDTDPAGF